MNNMGMAYHNLGIPYRAIEYYEQALSIAHRIGDLKSESHQLVP